MDTLPEHVKEKLAKLKATEDPSYYEDKRAFVTAVYAADTYDQVWKLGRYQAFRVWRTERDLLDEAVLGRKFDAVMDLVESARETV